MNSILKKATMLVAAITSTLIGNIKAEYYTGNMVKMCLFYPSPSGHARTDPILSQTCPSDHVHTFYGPKNFHPDTTYDDLINTKPEDSTTPFVENQSLYWHPSIYKVTEGTNGSKTYTRVNNLETGPYYRWDNSVSPKTEEFPPNFRMIAYSNQQNSNEGGEAGDNIFVECCNFLNGGEDEECTTTTGSVVFPNQACDFVGFAFAMPTCWNGEDGRQGDHVNHMAYTLDGSVAGDCPEGYDRRLPQIQLFVRITPYQGGTYVLANESNVFHVDFMNGWKEGVLQDIIDNCPSEASVSDEYNPPCGCDEFLTENTNVAEGAVCDSDVRTYVMDEAIDVMNALPRGSCNGVENLQSKSWDVDPPFTCETNPFGNNDDEETGGQDDTPVEEECFDSSLRFKVSRNGKKITRNCTWVGNKATSARCDIDGVAEICPETCDACSTCADSSVRFKLSWKGRKIARDCTWVGNKNTNNRCDVEGVIEACRETCGEC